MTFKVEFDITANRAQTDYTNVLHLTTGENCCGNGQRIPAVYISSVIVIITSLDGNGNHWVNYPFVDGQKYHFVIEQTLEDGIVMYKIIVDGEVFYSKQNNQPQNFNNVMAYVSDPWTPTFDGCLENLELTPGNGNLELKIVSFDYRYIKQGFHYTGLVSCGAQFAETCSDCPLDGCSDDCTLENGQCTKSEL